MSRAPCPACGCEAASAAHAVVACLRDDDVDAALDAGLLDVVPCPSCADACTTTLIELRDARRAALAARERFRARARRLERRAAQRQAARSAATNAPTTRTPALPPAAAEALQRALSRAKRSES